MVALLPRERRDGFSSSPLGRGCNSTVVVAIRSSAYPRFVRLSEHDASALLTFVSELRELEDPMPFAPRLVVRLQTLIAADSVCYSECDPVRRGSILQVWHEPDGEDGLTRNNEAFPDRDLWQSLRDTHPLFTYRRASGDWTTARKVSDFLTLASFGELRCMTPSIAGS
jgi:hypothetical protein